MEDGRGKREEKHSAIAGSGKLPKQWRRTKRTMSDAADLTTSAAGNVTTGGSAEAPAWKGHLMDYAISHAGVLLTALGELYLALAETFRANGISLPFPQREVRLRGPG